MRELKDNELNQVSGGRWISSLDFFGDLRFVPDGLRHEPSIVVVPTPSRRFRDFDPVSPRPDIDF